MRRLRVVSFGTRRFTIRFFCFTYLTGLALTDLPDLYCGDAVAGASATCTAPPASRAVPAAAADNFARAIFTDMGTLS